MLRKRAFWLAAFVLFSVIPVWAAYDPVAEQKKLQHSTVPTVPKDPNEELRKVQKLNNDQSIIFFTGQIKKTPKDAALYAKRGKAYSGNKDYAKALADYNKAVQLDAKIADAYVGRAVIHLMKKDYDKCWKDVHQAESLGGKFWPAFWEALKAGSGRDK